MVKKVAVIRGDGTGPELVDSMLKVLEASKAQIEIIPCEVGYEWWKEHGGDSFISPETWEALEQSDVCFKGPTTTLPFPNTPRSVAVSIRQRFDLYANVRPIKTYPGRDGPLGSVNFIIVREATEDVYTGLEYRITDDVAISIRKITRRASERIARYAFELARQKGWGMVIAVHKANILRETCGLFMEAVKGVSQNYPDIKLEGYNIDNLAQQLIKNPKKFNQNVMVGTNLFMDILSGEAAGLMGSIGCLYSANFGDSYAMFEPAHGSSPTYRGLDKVNPTATILAGAWMLDYIGEKDASKPIFQATEEVICEGKVVTYDLGGKASTSQMVQEIAKRVRERVG